MKLWIASTDENVNENTFLTIRCYINGESDFFSTTPKTILQDFQRIDPSITAFFMCCDSLGYNGFVPFSATWEENYIPSMGYYNFIPTEGAAGIEAVTGVSSGQKAVYYYWNGKLETGHAGVTYIFTSDLINGKYYVHREYTADPAYPVIACLQATEVYINGTEHETNEDPYSTSPDNEPDGGYGDFDYSGDTILPPDLPSISVVDSGFVTLYKPTLQQLKDLASYMWSGLFDIATFKKLFADPMDCIISLSIIPVNVPTGASKEITVGNIGTGVTSNVLINQFVKVKFNRLNIGLRTNTFADFAPYTKCQIFLPYIGCQSLNIDEIAGADIDLEYHIDLFTGACTAYLTCSRRNSDGSRYNSTLYQFTGNVIANIPFTGNNFNSFINSMIGLVSSAGRAAITGGAAASGMVGSLINTTMSMKPDVEKTGALGSTNGFLGIQKPYLILTYPNLCIPANRNKTVGTPSFLGLGMRENYTNVKLSDFHGFTLLHKVNVKNIPCTDKERALIESQLTTEGVILP